MRGTVEIFECATGRLVFSDGYAVTVQPQELLEQADYIVIRRYGPQHVPQGKICAFSLNEFLHWHMQGFPPHEAFSDISSKDLMFLY